MNLLSWERQIKFEIISSLRGVTLCKTLDMQWKYLQYETRYFLQTFNSCSTTHPSLLLWHGFELWKGNTLRFVMRWRHIKFVLEITSPIYTNWGTCGHFWLPRFTQGCDTCQTIVLPYLSLLWPLTSFLVTNKTISAYVRKLLSL